MFIIYTIPFISAIIGWATNYIAIKMLFHPKNPKNFYFFNLQGIFPKRKNIFAERLSFIVTNQLLSKEKIKEQLNNPKINEELKAKILEEISIEFEAYMKSNKLLAMFANKSILEGITKRIEGIIDRKMPNINQELTKKIDDVNLQKIVYDKIITFSNDRFEDLIMSVIKKELKFIEFAGAILGFMIGIVQVILIQFI